MKKIWIGAGVACALMLSGCGGSSNETAKTETPAASTPAGGGEAVPDEANGGTITGKVAFDGTAPKMPTLDMSDKPDCVKAHNGQPVKSQEVVVNGNGTLKNVFVWVKAGLPDKQWKVPANAVELDQKGCMYEPHVLGVMTGQNIEIKNNDPTNHNIHPAATVNADFNQSQSPGAPPIMKTYARQEVLIPVKCNVHPWMRAYIGVVSHPFYAVTGDDGTFTIKGLPPGTYTVEIVHEKYGKQEQQVTVGAKDSKTADFTVKS
jgi:plastocyanin